MIRVLHTADWQIGKTFGGFDPDDSVLLTAARIEIVKAIARCAAEEQVQLVLVAGDVFDAQTVTDKTIQQTFSALGAFAGLWVFLPGNHDAALAESVWTRAQRINAVPANALLCLTPEPRSVLDGAAVLLAAPLTQRNTYTDLTEWFPEFETAAGVVRIGLAHGSVAGILPDNIDSANPIAAGRAADSRLDYLALGDWHGLKQVDARTWYSGTPETDRFRSHDPGHVLIVDITSGDVPTVRPVQIGQHAWKSMAHCLTVPADLDVLDDLLNSLNPGDVVEMEITGRTDLAGRERLHNALSRAQGRVRALRPDTSALQLQPSQEDMDGLCTDGYLADTLEHLRTEQSRGADPALAADALVMLASTLHGMSHPEQTA